MTETASKTIIQITKSGLFLRDDDTFPASMREEFKLRNCLLLPDFLEPDLLRMVQRNIEQGRFLRKIHPKGIGSEQKMRLNRASSLLDFLLNDVHVFNAIRSLTGCGPIGCFTGRVYRMVSEERHSLDWHNDMMQNRMLALSLNLSEDVYRGGVLQIRDAQSQQTIHEIANTGFGDAIIFRIAPNLEHRLTDLEDGMVKIAYSGWFRSKPHYPSLFKRDLSRMRKEILARKN